MYARGRPTSCWRPSRLDSASYGFLLISSACWPTQPPCSMYVGRYLIQLIIINHVRSIIFQTWDADRMLTVYISCHLISMCSSIFNPVVYGCRNELLRKNVARMFGKVLRRKKYVPATNQRSIILALRARESPREAPEVSTPVPHIYVDALEVQTKALVHNKFSPATAAAALRATTARRVLVRPPPSCRNLKQLSLPPVMRVHSVDDLPSASETVTVVSHVLSVSNHTVAAGAGAKRSSLFHGESARSV